MPSWPRRARHGMACSPARNGHRGRPLTNSLERMKGETPRDVDITDPVHWKGWIICGAVGLVVSLLIGGAMGVPFLDVILLKSDALAFFQIGDYVLLGIGAVQAARVALGRLNGEGPGRHAP